MHILILNWRDRRNPNAGGAEVLTHEMAKRWVQAGHIVTFFTSSFRGLLQQENLDGVTIIRRGQWWNVHILAFFYYVFSFRNTTDIIVDEVHWVPFFSVLYARKKVVLLVCEVANRLFFHLFPYPLALIGRAVEKFYLFLYRSVPMLAISPSTKHDLIGEGIDERHITVLPMGLNVPRRMKRIPKEKTPTFLFVGRIHPLKGFIDAVEAMGIIHARIPHAKLWIVGTGDASYIEMLKDRIEQLHLVDCVQFFGYLSEKEKFMIYQRAHLLLVPSIQEGWGLTVTEAASQETPSVAYDTAGLRDVVVDGVTGVLTGKNTPEDLANAVLALWKNKKQYRRLQQAGKRRAGEMSWDKTATTALNVIQTYYEKCNASHH
jgi:glycosyltransferase involved in cell wall biosynthesis